MPTRPQVYLRLFFFGGGALEKIGKILKILEKMDKILKKNGKKILNKLCIMGQNFGRWCVVVVVVGGLAAPPLNPFLLCTINK